MLLSSALAATTTVNDNGSGPSGGALVALVLLGLVYVALIAAAIWAYVKIVTKAGYPGAWVLILLVPIVNLVFIFLFAFKEWPAQRETAYLRHRLQQYEAVPPSAALRQGAPSQQQGRLAQ